MNSRIRKDFTSADDCIIAPAIFFAHIPLGMLPHIGNKLWALKATASKMGHSLDDVIITVQDHGNTSAASIPLALSVGVAEGRIKPGDLLVTEAIGGGLAWGAVVLRW